MTEERFAAWLQELEQRHLADLAFSEVTRALRALSSTYVERRERLASRSAFDSAGKRAAYALYYGPLHFLTVRSIAEALATRERAIATILDLGCGTGAAGAAWATGQAAPPRVLGIDTHPWALREAAFTYEAFGLSSQVRRGHAAKTEPPRSADAIVLGWVLNELDEGSREELKARLLDSVRRHTQVLIIEPISTRVSPWWNVWARAFEAQGGRADEWRFSIELPDLVKRFDRAAGMRHDELKARTIYAY